MRDQRRLVREHAGEVGALMRELETTALSGPYVAHPSEVMRVKGALAQSLALEELAVGLGLADRWDELLMTLRALLHGLTFRPSEPEHLTLSSYLIRLFEEVAYAAGSISDGVVADVR